MAECNISKDCSAVGIHMKCIENKCMCDFNDFVLLEDHWLGAGCYEKAQLFSPCLTSGQCLAVNRYTYCNRNNRCTCSPGYSFDGRDCIIRYDNNLKAQEVYKAAVVAAACFIVAIVGIFVACIVRRSFCRRDGNGHYSTSTSSDIFSVSDEIAALRAVDKPPSYEEVLQIERTFYGIPPPEYSSVRGSSPRQNQNLSVITSNFANPLVGSTLQSGVTTNTNVPASDASTAVPSELSNNTNYSAVTTTALISGFSESSISEMIDTDPTTSSTSSQDQVVKLDHGFVPLSSGINGKPSQLSHFLPVILRPLTRHASLLRHPSPSSHFSHFHRFLPSSSLSSNSSASLPSSPQLRHHIPHIPVSVPSTEPSAQETAPQMLEDSQTVPSNRLATCISNLPSINSDTDDASAEESVNGSRRDSLILHSEDTSPVMAYVNPGFVDDCQK